MKRYELVVIAALLTIVFSMCSPTGAFREPRKYPSKTRASELSYWCSPPSSASYYVRSSCEVGGALTVHRGRVFLQIDGMHRYSKMGAFQKESCSPLSPSSFPFLPSGSSLSSVPIVRYRHRESGRYLCFSRRGNIRTVSARAVEKKGAKCMFLESRLDSDSATRMEQGTYHTIQSLARQGWFLGFNTSPSSTFAIRKGRHGRGALPRIGVKNPGASCGFRFHSELERLVPKEEDELMASILKYIEIENNEVNNKHIDNNLVNTIVDRGQADRSMAVARLGQSSTGDLSSDSSKSNRNLGKGVKPRQLLTPKSGKSGSSRKVALRRWRGRRRPVRHLNKKQPRPDRRTKNLLRQNKKRKSIMNRRRNPSG